MKLKKLSDNIYFLPANHDTDRPVLAAISGKERTLIVDAGNSSAHASLFLDELADCKIPPPEFVILTHWHWDHIFGMCQLNLPAIAHVKTRLQMELMLDYKWDDQALDQRLRAGVEVPFCADMIKKEFLDNREDIQIVLPEILFEDKYPIDLGGVSCVIENIGGDHSEDSSVVFVPEEKVLFLGDVLAPDLYVEKWFFTVDKLMAVLDKIETYDADIFVESHCPPVGKTEFMSQVRSLRNIASLITEFGNNIDEIYRRLPNVLSREVLDTDRETVGYFLNGLA